MGHSTLTVVGTNDTSMNYITMGWWKVCHRCYPFCCLRLFVADRGRGCSTESSGPDDRVPRYSSSGWFGLRFQTTLVGLLVALMQELELDSLASLGTSSLVNVYPWLLDISAPIRTDISIGHCSN